MLKPSLHRLPYRSDFVASILFHITPRSDHVETPRFQQYLYYCRSIHCCGNVFVCDCYLVTGLPATIFFLSSRPSWLVQR
jgi:hypothetical protein